MASGQRDLAPWAVAATAALLGGGAGLLPFLALDQLVPGPDPREHRNAPLDHADLTGPAFVMLLLTAATAAPALGVVALGSALDEPLVRWLGAACGVVTGVVAGVALGRAAARILSRRGPELLSLMRAGREELERAAQDASVLEAMARSRRRLLSASVVVGCIALFPQALVPAAMKLSGDVARVWVLALYLPGPWQWPAIGLMALLGGGAFLLAWRVYAAESRALRRRQPAWSTPQR